MNKEELEQKIADLKVLIAATEIQLKEVKLEEVQAEYKGKIVLMQYDDGTFNVIPVKNCIADDYGTIGFEFDYALYMDRNQIEVVHSDIIWKEDYKNILIIDEDPVEYVLKYLKERLKAQIDE